MARIITHDEQKRRFETSEDGVSAYVEYELADGIMSVTHTFVPKVIEGRNIASEMTRHLLEYAREKNLKIRPYCSFTRVYIKRHKEFEDMVC